jgi:hypothetical protein
MKPTYAEALKYLPLLAPQDIVATATATEYVKLARCEGLIEIAVQFGAIASTDSTGEVVVTIEANATNDTSSSDDATAAIAFNYRLSAAVGTDSMGAITAATTAGASVVNTNDNKTLLCYVDPSAVAGTAGQKYVRAVISPTAEVTSTIVCASARYIPRYAGNSISSDT